MNSHVYLAYKPLESQMHTATPVTKWNPVFLLYACKNTNIAFPSLHPVKYPIFVGQISCDLSFQISCIISSSLTCSCVFSLMRFTLQGDILHLWKLVSPTLVYQYWVPIYVAGMNKMMLVVNYKPSTLTYYTVSTYTLNRLDKLKKIIIIKS